MRYVKMLVAAAGLVVALAIGFWWGRVSAVNYRYPALRDWRDAEVTNAFARFQQLHRDIGQYILKQEGRIPADPYRAFVDAKVVSSYTDFMFDGNVVVFNALELPCRINTDVSRNVKAPFFWVIRPDISEVWVCYLDGSCERESRRGWLDPGSMSAFGKAFMSWSKEFHKAGYPYWVSFEEKARWCQTRGDRFEWNADKGFYVPLEVVRE